MLLFYRPGLLGITKYEFAKTYCNLKYIKGVQGKYFAVILSMRVCNLYALIWIFVEFLLAATIYFLQVTTEEHYLFALFILGI